MPVFSAPPSNIDTATSPTALCPLCSPDGGYGATRPDAQYRCTCCGTDWSQASVTTQPRWRWPLLARLERWITRRTLRATSPCDCWRR